MKSNINIETPDAEIRPPKSPEGGLRSRAGKAGCSSSYSSPTAVGRMGGVVNQKISLLLNDNYISVFRPGPAQVGNTALVLCLMSVSLDT